MEILIGVEHFSPKVLKILNKNYSMKKLFKALKVVKEDIKLPVMSLYTLVGLPGEDREAIRENINVFKKITEDKLYDFSFPKFNCKTIEESFFSSGSELSTNITSKFKRVVSKPYLSNDTTLFSKIMTFPRNSKYIKNRNHISAIPVFLI